MSLGIQREQTSGHLLVRGGILCRRWCGLYHHMAWMARHPGIGRSIAGWRSPAVLPVIGPLLLRGPVSAWSRHGGEERSRSDPKQQGQNCACESKMSANGIDTDKCVVSMDGGGALLRCPPQAGRHGRQ